MTRDKRKIIAGVTFNEWLRRPGRKPVIPARKDEVKKYSKKIIAFLDILGITALIGQHINNDEHKAIYKIEKIRKIVEDSTKIAKETKDINLDDFYYLQISDSFVFVCDPKNVVPLIELLSTIQVRIITECQFLLRGAITIGDAIVEEFAKYIVGPAYIQAYKLQDNDAIYPRIIVDKSVTQAIRKESTSIKSYLYRDIDKEFFVDYIKVYMTKESLTKRDVKVILNREGVLTYLIDNFNKNYQDEKHNISQKYGWTIQYYRKIGVWKNG